MIQANFFDGDAGQSIFGVNELIEGWLQTMIACFGSTKAKPKGANQHSHLKSKKVPWGEERFSQD